MMRFPRVLFFVTAASLFGGTTALAQPETEKAAPSDVPGIGRPTSVPLSLSNLERENRALQERIAELENQAREAETLERELAHYRARQTLAQDTAEARRFALATALRAFFESASLVDQAYADAQAQSARLSREGALVSPLPEVGRFPTQLRLMRMVRDYLRGQESIGGIAIRDVDRKVAARELTPGLTLDKTLFLNSFALERLRTVSDQADFPPALRAVLKSVTLLHEGGAPAAGGTSGPGGTPGSPGAPASGAGAGTPLRPIPDLFPSAPGGPPGSNTPPTPNTAPGVTPTPGAGRSALPFRATTLAGQTVEFPRTYAGRLVLLDFWATWCEPCREEVPSLVAAYRKYQPQGFEVLGVSLDRPNQQARLRQFMGSQGMTWPQIYDGRYWDAAVAQLYGIRSIPHPILVDGSTGQILADGSLLRADRLDSTLARILAGRSR